MPSQDTPKTLTAERARIQRAQNANLKRERLGLRLAEFCALVGISLPTAWRRVRAGDIRIIRIGSTPIVPRVELQRLGLIEAGGE